MSAASLVERVRGAFAADGFAEAGQLLAPQLLAPLRERFDALFKGRFETGIAPDEVNWQEGAHDPTLTRQICNGWKADRLVASTVLDAGVGEALARLAGWPGARLVQDNVLWKPPGARSLGFHRDNAYLAWYTPQEMFSCWIALDDTTESGGTLEVARGSHLWPTGADPVSEFHAPADYQRAGTLAAQAAGRQLEVVALTVPAGTAVFHHGWTWHGSGANRSRAHRRSLVLHCASSEARFHRPGFGSGNGPVYTRYARLTGDVMDENYFPILWRSDGYRTPGLPDAKAATGLSP